jgi:hypothetical protein
LAWPNLGQDAAYPRDYTGDHQEGCGEDGQQERRFANALDQGVER